MNGYSKQPLANILSRVQEPVAIAPHKAYKQVTVRLFHKGLVLRGEKVGSAIRTNRQWLVRQGQLLLSRIDARNGAIGIVPPHLDGAIVTNDFCAFAVNSEIADIAFLDRYFGTAEFVDACNLASEGTTNRVRLQPSRFLKIEVPLPPLDEQRRIVSRIEDLAARLEEALALKNYTTQETMEFWKVLSRLARGTNHPIRSVGEIVEFLDGRRIPLSRGERATRNGTFPYYGASGIIDYIDDYIFDEDLLLLSEDGANLINRTTPIAFIAKGKYWVNNHAHVLRPVPDVVDIKFLAYALSDCDVSEFNFASAQPKLNQNNARKISFPLPPLDEQRRIARHLDSIQAKVETLNKLQSETGAELDALMPSILSKAFHGEL